MFSLGRKRVPHRTLRRLELEVLGQRQLMAADIGLESELLYYDFLDERGVLIGGNIEVDRSDELRAAVEATAAPIQVGDVTTIIDNGPTTNRIDLVIVGDGYTETELGVYGQNGRPCFE